jgi:O-antigen/teichoic acid export membrane protein
MSNKSIGHNTIYNLVGSVVPVLVMIVTVPIYIKLVGTSRFGILALIWLLFGYLGLFDFGLSRATANLLAKLRGAPLRERSCVFYSALLVNGMIGLMIGTVFYLSAGALLEYLVTKSPELAEEIPATIPWIAALFPLALLGGVFLGSLEAEERFFEINIQQTIGTILMQCLPLAAVATLGPRLEVPVIAVALARVFTVVWNGVLSVRMIPPGGFPEIRMDVIRSLLKYGGWIAISNLIAPLLVSADQFMIGFLIGAEAVAYYSIPFSMAIKVQILSGAISRSLFPRLSGLSKNEAGIISFRASVFLAGSLAIICIPGIILSDLGINLWLGHAFASQATPLARTILVGIWINGIAFIPYVFHQSQGRPDIVAKFHFLEILPFLGTLWVLIHYFGLPGASFAFILRVTVDTCLLYAATEDAKRYFYALIPWGATVVATWILVNITLPRPIVAIPMAVICVISCTSAFIIINATAREKVAAIYARFLKYGR